jgi:hypothetical protein
LPYGTYSFTVLKTGYASQTRTTTVSGKWALEYFRLWPSPTESTPPPPTNETSNNPPKTTSEGRIQKLSTKVGFATPALTSANVQQIAQRYDIVFGNVPTDLISTLRATNPRIILLQYLLAGGEQNKSRYPSSYYVKDVTSRLKIVDKNGFYMLNFADPTVRAARRDAVVRAGVDGYWLDLAGPDYANSPYFRWRDENGKMADVGDLDGSWAPWMPESEKDRYTDGTWPIYMLDYIEELKQAQPGESIIFNGFPSGPTRDAIWRTHQSKYERAADGAAAEFLFIIGAPVSEDQWKWQIDRVLALVAAQKYAHIFVDKLWNSAYRLYGFASYLLVADGEYAWLNVYNSSYDETLFAADYGTPRDAYKVVSTPSGPLYKRQFSKATVWVNPGTVSRTGDGKTVGPKSAIIEKTSN